MTFGSLKQLGDLRLGNAVCISNSVEISPMTFGSLKRSWVTRVRGGHTDEIVEISPMTFGSLKRSSW